MLVDRPEVWTVIEVLSKNSGLADDVALAALADAYNVELDAFRAVVIAKLDEESGATTAAPTEGAIPLNRISSVSRKPPTPRRSARF